MARIKSDNRHLAIASGYETRWMHLSGSQTITPRSGEFVVLHRLVINTTSASAIVLRDSAVGVIATLAASILPASIDYGLRVKGNLVIENPGGSDLTVVFSND